MMDAYPETFTVVTVPLESRPVHVYPRNYADGVVALKYYQEAGYDAEWVLGEPGNILKPGYIRFTRPAGETHTYCPELAEIHNHLGDTWGYARPSSFGAVGRAWSAAHLAFYHWYFDHVPTLVDGVVDLSGTRSPREWAAQIVVQLRTMAAGQRRAVRLGLLRIADVIERRGRPREACACVEAKERCGICRPYEPVEPPAEGQS